MAGCNPWTAFWTSGIFTIATASFLFSVGTLAVRFLEDRVGQMPAFEVACIPSFCCSLVCSGVLLGQREPPLGRSVSHGVLNILRGIFGASSLIFFYLSVGLLPLKDAVTLFFTSPMIAVLLEWLVMGQFPGFKALLGCLLTVVGVVLVTQTKGESNPDTNALLAIHLPGLPDLPHIDISPGILCSLIAATSNAISFVVVQALAGRTSPIGLTWWYHTAVTVGTGIPLALGYPAPPKWPSLQQQGMLVFIVVCQLCGQICLNRGFSLVSATKGAAINVLQVLFSYIWELTILHEAINAMSAAGGAFVMAGVIVVALSGGSSKDEDEVGQEVIVEPTFTRTSFARTSVGRQSFVRKSVPATGSEGLDPGTDGDLEEPTVQVQIYETPLGLKRVRKSNAAAYLSGGMGLEVLTNQVIWRRSLPLPEQDGLLEPLLEDEGAPSEVTQVTQNTATEPQSPQASQGQGAV